MSKNEDKSQSTMKDGADSDINSTKKEINEKSSSNEPDSERIEEENAIEKEVLDARKEIEKLKDTILRIRAEQENYKRVVAKEMREAKDFAISKFAIDMVEILENLSRAVKSSQEDRSFDNMLDGINITMKAFEGALGRNKISQIKIEANKDMFDSHYHQALVQKEDKSLPEGTIVEVAQTGYMIGDRLLRPSLVIVSKQN